MALAVRLPLPDIPDARLWLKQEVDWAQLPGGATILVQKARQLRSVADAAGQPHCEIELGRARAGEGAVGTTLCFEAQADLSDQLRNLSLACRGQGTSLEPGKRLVRLLSRMADA